MPLRFATGKKTLSNGAKIPLVGLGTANVEDDSFAEAVSEALRFGYRHIDSAYFYRSEYYVGEGLKRSHVPRDQVWLTTKVWMTHYTRDLVRQSIEKSLADLQTDYVDLALLHWPFAVRNTGLDDDGFDIDPKPRESDGYMHKIDVPISETWAALEELVEEGKIRNLGVSNYRKSDLQELFTIARIRPVVNQIEMHPYLTQPALHEYCESQGIAITAYAPFGNLTRKNDPLRTEPLMVEDANIARIAEKHQITPLQVIMSWNYARGVCAVPAATVPKYIKDNYIITDLDKEDIEIINHLDRGKRYHTYEDMFGQSYLDYE
ncbi:hypothetical protein CANCADRAFT_3218 [Tortispora caseinolytica NRRL Y-17796]|uniref:NADP-dependent oxidoreductase domain-containing protein n=1 Tax=Tortispora caseinolytica NRRL Y-17796 TaxID=767744 RepID=A0A1E4TA02_9ASCO|nr:hypothetical protein CANCADRAFT_3218 [Tortispora caseinolytica NRRL Y-17796]